MPYDGHACPGPCNRRYREAVDAYDAAVAAYEHVMSLAGTLRVGWHPPERPSINPALGDPVWCGRCASLIRSALAELDDLASLLAAASDGHRGSAWHGNRIPSQIAKRSTAPSPSPIADTLDELYGALVKVEDDWREFRGYPPRSRRDRGGHARRLAIVFLLDELDAILAHPGSIYFGAATLAWQRRLRAISHSDPVGRHSPIRCPRCGEHSVRRGDDGYYECGGCGRLLSQEEHDSEYSKQADELAVNDDKKEVAAP